MTLRIGICGCGHRSRTVWQRLAARQGEVVGVQDPDPASFRAGLADETLAPERCFSGLTDMLESTKPDALIVCSINSAHAASVAAGLDAGCHVLVEKPFTTSLDDAVGLTATAERRELCLGVVQNWRTKSVGQGLRAAVGTGLVGPVSHVFFRYLRDREAARLPDYLFAEPDPLLSAMAIHHFDLFRFVLADEIVEVQGHAFRPAWSRYQHASSMQLWMRTGGGVVISYVATFSSRNGHLPLESLQVEGELGTLHNESQYSEPPLWLSRRGEAEMVDLTAEVTARSVSEQYDLADGAVLANFVAAVTSGTPLISPARDNLGTIAVLEAARLATHTAQVINPEHLLARAEADQREDQREERNA